HLDLYAAFAAAPAAPLDYDDSIADVDEPLRFQLKRPPHLTDLFAESAKSGVALVDIGIEDAPRHVDHDIGIKSREYLCRRLRVAGAIEQVHDLPHDLHVLLRHSAQYPACATPMKARLGTRPGWAITQPHTAS